MVESDVALLGKIASPPTSDIIDPENHAITSDRTRVFIDTYLLIQLYRILVVMAMTTETMTSETMTSETMTRIRARVFTVYSLI